MCWQNQPNVIPEIESPDANPHGPYSGEIRDTNGVLTDRAPIWGEPRPRPLPNTVN